MELFNDWITRINDLLWGYLLIAALLGGAVWFTLRTRGVQFRMLREMIRVLGESPGSAPRGERHVSSFQALPNSTSAAAGSPISAARLTTCNTGWANAGWASSLPC